MAAAAVRLRRFKWALELGTPPGTRAAGTWRCAHEADPHEPPHRVHGRQHHQHLPGHDGLAPAAGAALPLHHPEAAGELERAAAAGFGVPGGQWAGAGARPLQVPGHGAAAHARLRLARLRRAPAAPGADRGGGLIL